MCQASLCIAVVDDEESVRRAIARLLRSAGMEAVTFASGREFLEAARTRAFDCLVLDLHMPEMNGFEVQERIVREGVGVPVVIVTGHDTPEYHATALAAGVAAYLPKPVEAKLLLGAISAAVRR